MTGFLLQRYVFYFVLCCDRRTEWGGKPVIRETIYNFGEIKGKIPTCNL